MAIAASAQAAGIAAANQEIDGVVPVTVPKARPRLNSTGRDVALTVPLTDGLAFLGDIAVTVHEDDEIALDRKSVV